MRHRVFLLVLFAALAFIPASRAQEDGICTEQIQDALAFTDRVCSQIGRNQVCYGNQLLEATLVESVADFRFGAPGDIADLPLIDTLKLSQLTSPDEWGVALMQIQANLPATLPGQNVIMLLFGEVEIDNAGGETSLRLSGTLTSNANLRSGPGTGFAVAGGAARDTVVEVEGRSADNTWFRIRLPDEEQAVAWIFGNLIDVEGRSEDQPVMEVDEPAGGRFGPMQAFYFRTGAGQAQCVGAPRDGILIQTPHGQGEIVLRANEVDIRLGSTAFLRAIPGDYMTVDVIEGEGRVTALGATVFVPAGARARIALDEVGLPAGPPELTVYAEEDVANLPVGNLGEVVEIAPPLEESELIGSFVAGDWVWLEDFPAIYCGTSSGRVAREAYGSGEAFRTELTESGIRVIRSSNGFEREIPQTGPGVYSDVVEQTVQVGTMNYTTRIEWTSASGGIWTSISEFALSYCNETYTQQVAFERVG